MVEFCCDLLVLMKMLILLCCFDPLTILTSLTDCLRLPLFLILCEFLVLLILLRMILLVLFEVCRF